MNPFPVGARVQHVMWHDFGLVVDESQRNDCGSICCLRQKGWPVVQWDEEPGHSFQVAPHFLKVVA